MQTTEFNPIEDARFILGQLTPEQLAYAKDPARGEYRGFAALHDLMDANMILPGADELDKMPDGLPEEVYQKAMDDLCARGNLAMKAFNEMILAEKGAAE